MGRRAAAVREGMAHFRIDGADFTRIARDLMLSERPAQAWRAIAEGLNGGPPGAAEQIARDVLDGKSQLVGDESCMTVQPDDAAAYRADLRHIYAGRVRINARWWRPVARVDSFGQPDADHATRKYGSMPARVPGNRGDRARWAHYRVEFYAGPDELVMDVPSQAPVIFEPCGEPPFWWKPCTTVAEAVLDAASAGRALESRGFVGVIDDGSEEDVRTARAKRIAKEEDQADRELQEQEEKEREEAYRQQLASYADQVRQQAGSDTFELATGDGRTIVVPRAPFENWALRRTSLRHLAPPWASVCPSGLKLPLDDEYHSDWMLGAGLDLYGDYFDESVRRASYDAMYELQRQLGEFEAAVILPGRGTEVSGTVGKHIAVLPDLEMERYAEVVNALAIVTETGGALKHCALYAIEREIPIFLVPDAVRRFPSGTKLTLNPANGGVTVHVDRR